MRIEIPRRVVARGTWLYDGSIPHKVEIHQKPAKFACSRFDEDDELVESAPVPVTPDGFVYQCWPWGAEGRTLEEAKKLADGNPWGPVVWDE
jgi:hypothetical protein